ncbi:Selenocysteine-specific elongation factor [Porphyridium purpureum]|uniref:Selenocysteine-specific elongation factor n=1 Tax=Porphyridium purpureum TaxID=35688 RepID=A0A5J4YML5_PORPP|nr:Selenocysteine-specific elongation factor [Porphyridium purpureum]|eukprot:POR1944..scf295_9
MAEEHEPWMWKNVNVGVLGHVDAGKTSVVRALSNIVSTAALDKHRQAQERGITIDLGFSCMEDAQQRLRVTLVDCPGHASLIRQVIAAAQMIDLVLLVVDAQKLVQAQTAECLALSQILFDADQMVVALNKVDLLATEKTRTESPEWELVQPRIASTMAKLDAMLCKSTRFGGCPMVSVSARHVDHLYGMESLRSVLLSKAAERVARRQTQNLALGPLVLATSGGFILSVDHSFVVKGSGVVLTGILLRGSIRVGDMLELPLHRTLRKVKSIQIFRRVVDRAAMYDRVAVCLAGPSGAAGGSQAGTDLALLERATACSPGLLSCTSTLVMHARRVRHHKREIASGSKYHFSVGHAVVVGTVNFFYSSAPGSFSLESLFIRLPELPAAETDSQNETGSCARVVFAIVELEHEVVLIPDSVIVASRLDIEYTTNERVCRLAFSGEPILRDKTGVPTHASELRKRMRVGQHRVLQGTVDRLVSERELIARGMLKKHSAPERLIGMKLSIVPPEGHTVPDAGTEGMLKAAVVDSRECFGYITRTFGQSGKLSVSIYPGQAPPAVGSAVYASFYKERGWGSDSDRPIRYLQLFADNVASATEQGVGPRP